MNVYKKLVFNTKCFFDKNKIKYGVIGVSGGIDSALTLKIVCDAIGKKNVNAVFMPDKISSKKSENNAHLITDFCDVELQKINIDYFLQKDFPWKKSNFAMANFKARIRMSILYHLVNSIESALVCGTCNKSEILLGYFTKYGDGGSDVEILGNFYKTAVFNLAKKIKIPQEIIDAKPTAELIDGQNDEDDLGASYEIIDKIIKKFELKKKPDSKFEKEIFDRIKRNEHKRKIIPIIKI